MKKVFITLGVLGLVQLSSAQESFTPQYVEELHQLNDGGNLGGTARYKGLSGAMGALGGDLSATIKNPASAAVFLQSEGVITAGFHNVKTEADNSYTDSELQLDQAGAVMVFDDLNHANWKNVAVSMNYQQQDYINERIEKNASFTSIDGVREINGIYSEKDGTSAVTNLSVAANYNNQYYIGGGVNFHTFETSSYEAALVNESGFDEPFVYEKDYFPNARTGQGLSFGLGVIGKLSQQVRLGASYQSPVFYQDNEELVTEYAMYQGSDDIGDYYYNDSNVISFINDMKTGHKFTGSAAFVIGTQGLISADYTYTDYSTAEFTPENSFMGENNFISNNMNGTSAISIGAEGKIQDFTLRGGFRYAQSPFEAITINGINGSYQPIGDLTGFSLGAGYQFNGFFVDASYNLFKRDRNYLVYGDYYDTNSTAPSDVYLEDEALDVLSFNAQESGVANSIADVSQSQGNFSISLGLRF